MSLSIASAQVAGQNAGTTTNEIAFRFGAGYSDNILRRSSLEESGTYTAIGTVINVARDTTRVNAEVTGDLEFRNYSTEGVKDEPYGDLNARAELYAVPDRFSWIVEDQFGQGRVDPFNAIGPGNQEQINIFSTGPALYLPIGERTELRLSTLIGRRTYGDSVGFDNDTLDSGIGLYRQLSSTAEIGLNFESREVQYDDSQLDNTIERVYFSYKKTLANGTAALDVGGNSVDFISTSESQPYFNVSWTNDVSSRTTVAFDIEQALFDSSDNFRGGQTFEDPLRTTDVYERTSGGASVIVTPDRSRISASVRLGEDRYVNDNSFDNDMTQLRLTLERTVSERLTAGFDFNTVQRDFTSSNQRDEDRRTSLYFVRAFGRQLSIDVKYEHISRGGVNTGTYDENSIRVMLLYALRRAAAAN
jgi:hypothetical protein